jgi:hypothetical protein
VKHDPLQNLLEKADGSFSPPCFSDGIAGRVKTRAKADARSANQLKVSAAVLVLVLCVARFLSFRASPQLRLPVQVSSEHLTAIQVDKLRREVIDLDADAAQHREKAELLRREERLMARKYFALPKPPQADDIGDEIDRARDRAARILVLQANHLISIPSQHAGAEQAYRRAIALFPDTPAAREAAARLQSKGA